MNERDFCMWLQGYMELTPPGPMSQSQIEVIKDHLSLVFDKVTPKRNLLDDVNRKIWKDGIISPPDHTVRVTC